MQKKLKIDIISDVVCPWCIIGYKHLEAAINDLGVQDKVEIEWHPFELNPDMPAKGENLRQHAMRKYGSSAEDSIRTRENITQQGAEYGFVFNYFDDMKMVNTLDAHVLLDYAEKHNKQMDLKIRLFNAFFNEQKDVSDKNILIQEAVAVGLNTNDLQTILEDQELKDTIRNKERQWMQLGIHSVPSIVFNESSLVTGAHPEETYKQILQALLD